MVLLSSTEELILTHNLATARGSFDVSGPLLNQLNGFPLETPYAYRSFVILIDFSIIYHCFECRSFLRLDWVAGSFSGLGRHTAIYMRAQFGLVRSVLAVYMASSLWRASFGRLC